MAKEQPPQYAGRIVAIDDLAQDTRVLRVELDNRQRLDFQPGQYVLLQAGGHEPRAFSIASSPQEEYLEFHVRNSGHGFSTHVFEAMKPGMPLAVSGPLGRNVWQDHGRPLLALAGGIGIAPMKSIIPADLAARGGAPVALYWGVRNAEQLYLDSFFRSLATKHARFSYIPVLSDAAGKDELRHGFIGQAIAEDFDSLHGFTIYMAGPIAMIDATMPALEKLGAEKGFILSDAFSA